MSVDDDAERRWIANHRYWIERRGKWPYSEFARFMDLLDSRDAALREAQEEIAKLRVMADAAEEWYWANNRATLDAVGSKERVFDALRLLGRYPPSETARPQPATPSPVPPQAVSAEEYEHFLDVMASPAGPTPALLKGAELLRQLRTPAAPSPVPPPKADHPFEGGAKASAEDVTRALFAKYAANEDIGCPEMIAEFAAALSARGAEGERAGIERVAKLAESVQQRAVLNAQVVKECNPGMSLDRLREIDNRMTGQRHAADEIARAARALLPPAAPEK